MKLFKNVLIFALVLPPALLSVGFIWAAYVFLSIGSLTLTWCAWLCGEPKTWKQLFEEVAKDFYFSSDPFSVFDEKSV